MSGLSKQPLQNEVETLTSLMIDTDIITSALHTTAVRSRRTRYNSSLLQLRLSLLRIVMVVIIIVVSLFWLVSQLHLSPTEVTAVTFGLTQEVPTPTFAADFHEIEPNS